MSGPGCSGPSPDAAPSAILRRISLEQSIVPARTLQLTAARPTGYLPAAEERQ